MGAANAFRQNVAVTSKRGRTEGDAGPDGLHRLYTPVPAGTSTAALAAAFERIFAGSMDVPGVSVVVGRGAPPYAV
jgi:hypothetical protein